MRCLSSQACARLTRPGRAGLLVVGLSLLSYSQQNAVGKVGCSSTRMSAETDRLTGRFGCVAAWKGCLLVPAACRGGPRDAGAPLCQLSCVPTPSADLLCLQTLVCAQYCVTAPGKTTHLQLGTAAQVFPDAINRPEFPQCTLRPGQVYRHIWSVRFYNMTGPRTA